MINNPVIPTRRSAQPSCSPTVQSVDSPLLSTFLQGRRLSYPWKLGMRLPTCLHSTTPAFWLLVSRLRTLALSRPIFRLLFVTIQAHKSAATQSTFHRRATHR